VLKVVIGPVASGSAVIADEDIVAEIKLQNREVCAVEMECYGVFAAVANSSTPQPHVFTLKAVCDFADPHKNDKVQRYAAYSSARVMQLMLERYVDRLV
jgi:nucleoside phosphorylase